MITPDMRFKVAIYIWPGMTMLDALAPHQVLGLMSELDVYTFAKTTEPFRTDTGMTLVADYGLDGFPDPDILIVGGGANPLPELFDDAAIAAIRTAGEQAAYVTSVCTGALILAEAGLLTGYRATTHWAYRHLLAQYPGVEVVDGRVVADGNRITGGGITAGLDFALTLIAEVLSPASSMVAELALEYDPQPPNRAGSPERAMAPIVDHTRRLCEELSPGLAEHCATRRAARDTAYVHI
jgi:cyclohexyl-isocyanide hydratase